MLEETESPKLAGVNNRYLRDVIVVYVSVHSPFAHYGMHLAREQHSGISSNCLRVLRYDSLNDLGVMKVRSSSHAMAFVLVIFINSPASPPLSLDTH